MGNKENAKFIFTCVYIRRTSQCILLYIQKEQKNKISQLMNIKEPNIVVSRTFKILMYYNLFRRQLEFVIGLLSTVLQILTDNVKSNGSEWFKYRGFSTL